MTVRWTTAFLDFPAPVFEPGCSFWKAATASALSPQRGDSGQFATLVPAHGDAFLRVQRIGEGPSGCHLDVHVDDVDETAELAVRLGATVLETRPGIVLMSSPGRYGFCVVRYHGEAHRPPPLLWPGGHSSLADQLCLDIPPGAHASECAFWAALTGWECRAGSRPEFCYLVRPAAMPLRLLLQRTDDEAEGCTAHLDFACDDVAAEERRHRALGATVLRTMPNWTTLVCPAGLSYCITRRDPITGSL